MHEQGKEKDIYQTKLMSVADTTQSRVTNQFSTYFFLHKGIFQFQNQKWLFTFNNYIVTKTGKSA